MNRRGFLRAALAGTMLAVAPVYRVPKPPSLDDVRWEITYIGWSNLQSLSGVVVDEAMISTAVVEVARRRSEKPLHRTRSWTYEVTW